VHDCVDSIKPIAVKAKNVPVDYLGSAVHVIKTKKASVDDPNGKPLID
jgi:hypothetical protein